MRAPAGKPDLPDLRDLSDLRDLPDLPDLPDLLAFARAHWPTRAPAGKPDLPALPRELPVLDPVRLVRRRAEAALPVGLVILIIPLEPNDLAVALERQPMRRDAIEEPSIVAA